MKKKYTHKSIQTPQTQTTNLNKNVEYEIKRFEIDLGSSDVRRKKFLKDFLVPTFMIDRFLIEFERKRKFFGRKKK